MFRLDIQGKCATCLQKAKEETIIRCDVCEFYYHGICDSEEGNKDGIVLKTHLGQHKKASTKPNFIWKCDCCLTIHEQNQASSVREMFTQLVDRFTLFENKLPQTIKALVKEEFEIRAASQVSDMDKLSESIATKISKSQASDMDKLSESIATKISESEPVQSNLNMWNDTKKVEELKTSMLIKPDKDGNPVNPQQLQNLIINNGVSVNKVVVNSSGDTFVNLPNQKSREKLEPLLKADKIENAVVILKSKLPTIKILSVTDKLTNDQIKNGICNQNEIIGSLVKDHGEHMEVIYTRDPPQGKPFYQVTLRVSPRIRKVIANNLGGKVFLSSKNCAVVDSFHVKRCNKCQAFGHYADKCGRDVPTVCGYCGENHKSNDCALKDSPQGTHKCRNCQVAGFEEFEGHSTFFRDCPAYVVEQKKLESAISYDYNNLN